MCSLKTSRRGNVIRHIKEVHGIEDRDARNATKNSNTGLKSNGKDQTTKDSNELQSRMLSSGRPMSEERYPSMNSAKRTIDLQDGGQNSEISRH